ncbi:Nidogen-2 [Holothuria leucospilota]|uniref:Nidogen-2 n=1 Tax=Holothuria leucospilota TaxID=206669 RepID=A0A9Q1CM58_HOLLE|nr:Nidogen-2 [Holothuria leucospilota]
MKALLILVWFLTSYPSPSAASDSLFSYGQEHGDDVIVDNSKDYETIELEIPINFQGQKYQRVNVNKNGYLSLGSEPSSPQIVDHRIRLDSAKNVPQVYARKTVDSDLKKRISAVYKKRYGVVFDPEQILIATWNQVGCPGEESLKTPVTKTFSFQSVIASNQSRSFVVFAYDGLDLCEDAADTKTCTKEDGNCPDYNEVTMAHYSKEGWKNAAMLQQIGDNVPSSSHQFFQLQISNGRCLSLSYQGGLLSECTDENGGLSARTVFRVSGVPQYQQIDLFGTGQCLDREHCHSSTSNLRYSDCDHCGAIHWDLRSDGTLREDAGNNCIYVVESTNTAAVHHSTDGCTPFNIVILGDSVLLKSISHGDCLEGSIFQNCGEAPRFFIDGLPGYYQIQDPKTKSCLDREHCHSSTSNIRLYNYNHCGAIHWSIVGTQVGEDGMKNCVNRDGSVSAIMEHCSDSWEQMAFEVVQSSSTKASIPTGSFLPLPVVKNYVKTLSSIQPRGIKLSKNTYDESATLEIVHFLPLPMRFSVITIATTYNVQFWVAQIKTEVAFSNDLVPRGLFEKVISNIDVIKDFSLRYGAVDSSNQAFGEEEGLQSLFVTNTVSQPSVQVPYDRSLLQNLRDAFNKEKLWDHPPSVKTNTYKQSYYTFSSNTPYRALYWQK